MHWDDSNVNPAILLFTLVNISSKNSEDCDIQKLIESVFSSLCEKLNCKFFITIKFFLVDNISPQMDFKKLNNLNWDVKYRVCFLYFN